MEWQTLLAIITTVPALAWFVNAFINIFKFYRKNEAKIKDKAVDIKEKAEDLGEKVGDKIGEKFHKDHKDPKPPQQNDERPNQQSDPASGPDEKL